MGYYISGQQGCAQSQLKESLKRKPHAPVPAQPGLLVAPRLPKQLAAGSLPGERVTDGEQYTGLALVGGDLSGQVAEHPDFSGVSFTRVDLSGTHFRRPQFSDVRFEGCNLANARWDGAIFQRVEFIGCRLLGFSIGAEGSLRDTLFRECSAPLAKFRFATCKGVRFEECILTEGDFQSTDLSGVIFRTCDLRHVEMSGVTLAGADLRGSNLDGLRVGPTELRGAIVDPPQAVAVARLLGLTVEWGEGQGEEARGQSVW